mmetsp:Transcript_7670/g.11290  ORF Transcript_7670/g.11290 Transcript_7670/m.11290 type:complete len:329 (-) Transcript_7670:101-1087(-)
MAGQSPSNATILLKLEPCCLDQGNSGVGGVVGDVASVGSVGKADEARLTPGSSPAVAYLPVSLARVNADSLHAVVYRGSAGRHDASSVCAPGGSIEADGERASGSHVGSHLGLTTDGVVVGDGDLVVGGVRRAGAGAAVVVHGVRVWVVILSLKASSAGHVRVGALGPAAAAAIGGGITAHNLSRGEDESLAQGAHGVGLDLLGGREGPARTAVSLVLHRSGVGAGPVLGNITAGEKRLHEALGGVRGASRLGSEVASVELGRAQVHELSDAVDSSAAGMALTGVTFIGKSKVGNEDLEAGLVLCLGLVGLSVLSLERLPHELKLLLV